MTSAGTPDRQLRAAISKFSPSNRRLIESLRRVLRKRLPAVNELVYDNYNFLVIAYCPTQKVSDSYFSIGADKHGAKLFFGYNGAKLPDPAGLLQGSGKLNRFLPLETADILDDPAVRSLLASALAAGKPPVNSRGTLTIRSVSAKQRPRR